MRLVGRFLRWCGGACYGAATKLEPPAPLVATEPETPSDLERARELVATMQATRAQVERDLADEQTQHDSCVDLAQVREQRAAEQRRDSVVITTTRGELRRACAVVLSAALEHELARRFRPRLVAAPTQETT